MKDAASRSAGRASMLRLTFGLLLWGACSSQGASDPEQPAATGERCLGERLPLQDARAFTLGETFYLPELLADPACPQSASWEVAGPAQSRSKPRGVSEKGASSARFTPTVEGTYKLTLAGIPGAEIELKVVRRTAAERFRNHYLTPLFGAARVGEELWVGNGAAYSVTRLVKGAGGWSKRDEIVTGAWPAAVAAMDETAQLPFGLVAQRGADSIGFIDRETGVLEDALWVGDEPTGLALLADKGLLYVSLATERAVAVVDVRERRVIGRIEVGFDPRALVASADGKRLYVASYRSGNLQDGPMGMRKPEDDQDIWIVDTERRAVVKTVLSVSADLRALALSADGRELFVSATDGDTVPPQTDATAKAFVHEAVVVSVDEASADFGTVKRRADLTRQASAAGRPFVSPAGVLAVGDALWLAAESSGEVVVLDAATLAERQRVAVGAGPRQLVALPGGGVAVHCFQDFTLWVLDRDAKVVQTVALSEDPRPAKVALGERVFSRPGAGFAANHACTGCHIETQNDGMVWRFGPRIWHNVRPLQLLAATTPLEWGAYVSSADNFGFQGPASIVGRPATTEEAEGLAAFLGSLLGAPRATGHTLRDGSYTAAGLRGKALFEKKLSCAGCHVPPLYTNRGLIGSGKSGEPADVPSLLGVYRHGVYMVDGKARSLEAAVDRALAFVKTEITPEERADLLEFLRQLTPKGAAPLGIWPDIDSNQGVYPDVQPWVAFSEPVDDGQLPGTAQSEAAAHVVLEDAAGQRVAGTVRLEQAAGERIVFVPAQPLRAGEKYVFRVLPGLRFRAGGALEGERRTEFTVARAPAGELQKALNLTVTLPAMGPPPAPAPVVLPLDLQAGTPGSASGVLSLGPNQQQRVWLRVDGDAFVMQPFALPLPGRGTADAAKVGGKVTATADVMGKKTIAKIEGTLQLGAPGVSVPGVVFSISPR